MAPPWQKARAPMIASRRNLTRLGAASHLKQSTGAKCGFGLCLDSLIDSPLLRLMLRRTAARTLADGTRIHDAIETKVHAMHAPWAAHFVLHANMLYIQPSMDGGLPHLGRICYVPQATCMHLASSTVFVRKPLQAAQLPLRGLRAVVCAARVW